MWIGVDRALRSSRLLVVITIVGSVALVAAADRLTGWEVSFSIFYLLPVSVAAWYVGPRAGGLTAVVAATTWLLVDAGSKHLYSHPAIPIWNALVRLGFFLVAVTLLRAIRQLLRREAAAARRDPLTSLLNSRGFYEAAEPLLAAAERSGRPVALAFFDLDDFKSLNDGRGHAQGDLALIAVAAAMRAVARGADLVARVGGDEFAVLMPDTNLAAGETAMMRHCAAILAAMTARAWPVGVSAGVAAFAEPPFSLDETMKAADRRMYVMKERSRNDRAARRSEAGAG